MRNIWLTDPVTNREYRLVARGQDYTPYILYNDGSLREATYEEAHMFELLREIGRSLERWREFGIK